MLNEILQKLNENSDAIVELLDYYECGKIKVNTREVRFARDNRPESGLNISIRLENNDACLVKDFARSEVNNIISWLCKEKNADFKSVLLTVKRILNLSDDWRPRRNTPKLFGGVYDCIINKTQPEPKTYPEEILKQYVQIGNELWLKDGISLEVQREFDVCFSPEDNAIIFPWKDAKDDIIAIKSRYNGTPPEGMSKYFYPVGGNISSSLYGYSHNYQYLYGNDVVIVEAEKSCLQGCTFGYRNIVAIGSNNLSEAQSKLILQLQPKRIIMALDEGLEFEQIKKNLDLLKSLATMRRVKLYYWDSTLDLDIPSKASPTDMGVEKFNEIMQEQLVEYT